ncbi:hypothetical protein [Vulgatibacter sp.]|uniref:hypothetical protein n=1 Tax=Vulgatibacter sp. TaxID=1971226 RepID=UPI00356836C4
MRHHLAGVILPLLAACSDPAPPAARPAPQPPGEPVRLLGIEVGEASLLEEARVDERVLVQPALRDVGDDPAPMLVVRATAAMPSRARLEAADGTLLFDGLLEMQEGIGRIPLEGLLSVQVPYRLSLEPAEAVRFGTASVDRVEACFFLDGTLGPEHEADVHLPVLAAAHLHRLVGDSFEVNVAATDATGITLLEAWVGPELEPTRPPVQVPLAWDAATCRFRGVALAPEWMAGGVWSLRGIAAVDAAGNEGSLALADGLPAGAPLRFEIGNPVPFEPPLLELPFREADAVPPEITAAALVSDEATATVRVTAADGGAGVANAWAVVRLPTGASMFGELEEVAPRQWEVVLALPEGTAAGVQRLETIGVADRSGNRAELVAAGEEYRLLHCGAAGCTDVASGMAVASETHPGTGPDRQGPVLRMLAGARAVESLPADVGLQVGWEDPGSAVVQMEATLEPRCGTGSPIRPAFVAEDGKWTASVQFTAPGQLQVCSLEATDAAGNTSRYVARDGYYEGPAGPSGLRDLTLVVGGRETPPVDTVLQAVALDQDAGAPVATLRLQIAGSEDPSEVEALIAVECEGGTRRSASPQIFALGGGTYAAQLPILPSLCGGTLLPTEIVLRHGDDRLVRYQYDPAQPTYYRVEGYGDLEATDLPVPVVRR